MKNTSKKFIFTAAFLAVCSSFSTANAGYLGENLQIKPTSAPNAPTAPAVAPVADVPLLIIRFNQPHVYFQEPLKKVVAEVNYAKSDANYEIQSVLPISAQNSSSQNSDKALLVTAELNKLGVSTSRISSNISYSNDVINQEIRVFVK